MTGLCGWFSNSTDASTAGSLEEMARRLTSVGAYSARMWEANGRALAVASGLNGPLHVGQDGIAVAIHGAPRWTSPARREQADREGWAASVHAAYQEHGEACLDELHGPFVLAVLDPAKSMPLLAIDRFGVEALAYARTEVGMTFASNADALRVNAELPPNVTPQGVYRFMLNGVSPAPETVYEGWRKLLPSHKISPHSGDERQVAYWRVPYDGSHATADFSDLRERLFDALRNSMARAIDRPWRRGRVGCFLSGGLDSSALCGILRDLQVQRVPAFTISFADQKYNELEYARAAAEKFDLDHHVYELSPTDVVDLIDRLPDVFDEPFANSSVIPAYYCSQLARREGIDLMVAGDGGDELFGGNKRYAEQNILQAYHHIPRPLQSVLASFVFRLPEALMPTMIGKARRYIRRARMPMPERMLFSLVFGRDALAEIFTDETLAELDVEEPFDLWRRHYQESGSSEMIYSMLHLDMRITLADNDLRKVGRAADLAGIEVAYPMLDEELVSFAAGLPPEQLVKQVRLRHFFRNAMKGFLPDKVLQKSKHGFGMPFVEWSQTHPELRDLTRQHVTDLKSRKFFRPEFVDRALQTHQSGAESPTNYIVWDLLMLELWLKRRDVHPATVRPLDPVH